MRKAFEKVKACYIKIRYRKALDLHQRARKAIRSDRRENPRAPVSNIPNSLDRPRQDVKSAPFFVKGQGVGSTASNSQYTIAYRTATVPITLDFTEFSLSDKYEIPGF